MKKLSLGLGLVLGLTSCTTNTITGESSVDWSWVWAISILIVLVIIAFYQNDLGNWIRTNASGNVTRIQQGSTIDDTLKQELQCAEIRFRDIRYNQQQQFFDQVRNANAGEGRLTHIIYEDAEGTRIAAGFSKRWEVTETTTRTVNKPKKEVGE